MRILHVVGARPNFMKTAPLMKAWREYPQAEVMLVHTGQHYDSQMSQQFIDELGLPMPDVNLQVGSGSHAVQTAEVMKRLEPLLLEFRPDVVVVPGDVNSTLAASLTAVKLGFPVAHIEAGLRSFDRTMPEEVNRIVTDTISRYLFVSEPSGVTNLRAEGISDERVFFVGNLMVDTILSYRQRARSSSALQKLNLTPRRYVLLTLHRPSNVDTPEPLEVILAAMAELAGKQPVVWPMHPRARDKIRRFGFGELLDRLTVTEPLGYLDFLHLMDEAQVVFTDSGGIQEETTALGVPCVTLRPNTERPITLTEGTNVLCEIVRESILMQYQRADHRRSTGGQLPDLWDGHAGERAAKVLLESVQP